MSQLSILARSKSASVGMDATWKESDHPRKHGQFAPKGTGTTSGGKSVNKSGASNAKSSSAKTENAPVFYNNPNRLRNFLVANGIPRKVANNMYFDGSKIVVSGGKNSEVEASVRFNFGKGTNKNALDVVKRLADKVDAKLSSKGKSASKKSSASSHTASSFAKEGKGYASAFNKAWKSYNRSCENDNASGQKTALAEMEKIVSNAEKISSSAPDKEMKSKIKDIISDMKGTLRTAKAYKGHPVEFGIGGITWGGYDY